MTHPQLTRAEDPKGGTFFRQFNKSPEHQSLYLLRHPWEQWLKVGVANHVERRMEHYVHAWGCRVPTPLTVIPPDVFERLQVPALRVERFIKIRYEEYRLIKREWLRMSPAVIEMEAIARENPDDLPRFLHMPGHG
jgi:hypothetical protein